MPRTNRVLAFLLLGSLAIVLYGCPKKPPPESVAPPMEADREADRAMREAESFATGPPTPEQAAADAERLGVSESSEAGVTPVAAIRWTTGYEATMERAASQNKPALVFFWGEKFAPAQMMDEQNWSDLKVRKAAEKFVCGRVDVGQEQGKDTAKELGVQLIPTVLFLTSDGKEISRIQHLVTPDSLVHEMLKAAG